jgi:hypothetical protein
MVRLTRKGIQDYISKRLAELKEDETDQRDTYQETSTWLERTKGIISRKKFEGYINSEIDWLIDCARCERRGTGRIRASTRRVVYSCRQTLYNILRNFGLQRVHTL